MAREFEPLDREKPDYLVQLPPTPPHLTGAVKAWSEPVEILTYDPSSPDRNPMFLEKRVYQGSSGRVYPLPFIDRIATQPQPKHWDAIHIENEYLRLMILPDIGGRIHIGYDKTTGFDFFYRQNVIKPALVGLAGPWISGGVEFNWPQHHRPATFMPVKTEIEQHADGSVTVWCSDHDPMLRMKGMHGVCLHPGRAVLELKVRLYNRTQFTQTFLWWANIATRVHEKYQSFFPTDVQFVADHAKRAVTSFPQSNGIYYGVDYARRAASGIPPEEMPPCFVPDGSYPANDLRWYANIQVPTSYMIIRTNEDFFGGYDHAAEAGIVHVANHHIAPGKKQWTWGNHEFGYTWDRSLTDRDGPYIELMAGAYTDNQPDFSFLAPWETKSFTQSWFPIAVIGVPQASNLEAALSLRSTAGSAQLGLYVTHDLDEVVLTIRAGSQEILKKVTSIRVAEPLVISVALPVELASESLSASVMYRERLLIAYDQATVAPAKAPAVAFEPAQPHEMATIEELYLAGLHLYQYRHATRLPESYWFEAVKRDPEDSRVNNALGLWRMFRGEFKLAAMHFEISLKRLTSLNPNPYDGEPYYNLGLVERYRHRETQAYDAFYKATWNAAWRGPAYFALAEIDASRGDWRTCCDHLKRSLLAEADNLNARNLLVLALTQLGCVEEATIEHRSIRALDRLDIASRYRDGHLPANGQEFLDLAFDWIRSGQKEAAVQLLMQASSAAADGSTPIILYTLAQLEAELCLPGAAGTLTRASMTSVDLCFPSRLEEMQILQAAIAVAPDQWAPHYLLGNWLYDRRRHHDAIAEWHTAAKLRPDFPTVWRNLGIAAFNVLGDASAARTDFDRALAADPADGRILYERDQLWKRTGVTPAKRIAELQHYSELLLSRDNLSVELATLYNQLDEPQKALDLLLSRQFQPWEGGEGLVLAQYVRSHLLLGQALLDARDVVKALDHFKCALDIPSNLSEAKPLLANQSNIYYWIGTAHQAMGNSSQAVLWWERATRQHGDFQQMAAYNISEMTYWTGLAQLQLNDHEAAASTFKNIYEYSIALEQTEPKIDYFATSLPTMLLFEEDLARRNRIAALFLRAQALTGLNRIDEAEELLKEILELDSNHTGASDLLKRPAHVILS
jgi:tetratricopeptide (TPR) repeat protein